MSATANKHRRHLEFEVGDFVWLKLQPYRQHSVAKPLSAKLSKRFYGPFEILQRVGPVAYKLRLPEGSRVHNVFHVSLLRAFVKGDESVDLPPHFKGDRPIAFPVSILDSQVRWHNGAAVEHVLVRWSDGTESPSWEPLTAITRRFPNLPLEGKEVSKTGGVVRNAPNSPTPPMEQVTDGTTPSMEPERENVEEEVSPVEESEKQDGVGQEDRSKEVSTTTRSLRPREQIKPPERFQNYVAK